MNLLERLFPREANNDYRGMPLAGGVLHPLSSDYYITTPPGKLAAIPALVIVGGLLIASLRPPDA